MKIQLLLVSVGRFAPLKRLNGVVPIKHSSEWNAGQVPMPRKANRGAVRIFPGGRVTEQRMHLV